jgi:uncharacterized LabA/DUF88 family protein
MDRVAVLVDAGYFFAAGSALVSGNGKQRRDSIVFDPSAAAAALKAEALRLANSQALLRIYWYDGASRKTGPTAEHVRLAHCNDVKVRLGFISASGQQKGVDSLIVTDMVELARNRAVSDLVLMSGDEDVRIGVQLAQSYGVRVHLLGIKPARGTQSTQLLQEADTCTEWDLEKIKPIVSIRSSAQPIARLAGGGALAHSVPKAASAPPGSSPGRSPRVASARPVTPSGDMTSIDALVQQVLGELTPAEREAAVQYMASNANNVPYELDGKLLARCRTQLGRNLEESERRHMRKRSRELLRSAKAA